MYYKATKLLDSISVCAREFMLKTAAMKHHIFSTKITPSNLVIINVQHKHLAFIIHKRIV